MDTSNITKLLQSGNITQINQKLGVLAPFFWEVYGSFAVEGVDPRTALDKTFQIVHTYFAQDVVQLLTQNLSQVRAA